MLLPAAVHHGSAVWALIAADQSGQIAGAAAISPRLRAHPMPGPRFAVHVIPPARGKGLGGELTQTGGRFAHSRGAQALYSWDLLEADSPAIAAWAKLGFDQSVRVEEGRADVKRVVDYLEPLYQSVVERRWIPGEARIIPLNQADPRQIARLHVDCLGGTIDDLLRLLRGDAPARYDPALSAAIIVDGRVVGFTLTERTGAASGFVHATVVHPALRKRWANLWLKYHVACRCMESGITTLLYHSYDQHSDTRRFNRVIGATIRTLLEPYRVLGAACSSGED